MTEDKTDDTYKEIQGYTLGYKEARKDTLKWIEGLIDNDLKQDYFGMDKEEIRIRHEVLLELKKQICGEGK